MRINGLCRGALAVFFLLATACPEETAIWVEPESTAARLVFGIADRRGGTRPVSVGVLRVSPCSADDDNRAATWIIEPVEETQRLGRVVYGAPPSGFISSLGPKRLSSGCYHVVISGTGHTTFIVSDDGAVHEEPPS